MVAQWSTGMRPSYPGFWATIAVASSIEMPAAAITPGSRFSRSRGVSTIPGTKENTATPDSFPISRATVNASERSAILVAA